MESHHNSSWESTRVLDKEDREFPHLVREAIEIRKISPELIRNQGQELPFNITLYFDQGHQSSKKGESIYTVQNWRLAEFVFGAESLLKLF